MLEIAIGVLLAIKSNDELATGEIGKKFLETVSVLFRGTDQIETTVVDSVPGSRFLTEGTFPPLLPRMEIEIHHKDNGRQSYQKVAAFC